MDGSAYEAFYANNYMMVLRYLARKCASYHDAEDLANECFMYCYQRWEDYDPQKASLKTWLFLIVRSRWKNYLRDHRSSVSLDELEDVIPGDNVLDQMVWLQTLRDEIASLLTRLPEKQKDAIILRYFEQWSDEEIARWMGTSKVNVRVMIHRGLQKMNQDLPTELRMV